MKCTVIFLLLKGLKNDTCVLVAVTNPQTTLSIDVWVFEAVWEKPRLVTLNVVGANRAAFYH